MFRRSGWFQSSFFSLVETLFQQYYIYLISIYTLLKQSYSMERSKIETYGYQLIEKEVLNAGNSGRVFVPKSWIGKKVAIILKEPLEE
jgi:putative transposon-encoded protein